LIELSKMDNFTGLSQLSVHSLTELFIQNWQLNEYSTNVVLYYRYINSTVHSPHVKGVKLKSARLNLSLSGT